MQRLSNNMDMLNSVEFVPLAIGFLWVSLCITGLFFSVGWIVYLLVI